MAILRVHKTITDREATIPKIRVNIKDLDSTIHLLTISENTLIDFEITFSKNWKIMNLNHFMQCAFLTLYLIYKEIKNLFQYIY